MFDYTVLSKLGCGYEGDVYHIVDDQNREFVLKKLNRRGKKFVHITKQILSTQSPHLYKVQIVQDKFHLYVFEKLNHIERIREVFGQICDIQKALLQQQYIYWDFMASSPNFMINERQVVKLVDYGGSGFLPTKVDNYQFKLSRGRRVVNDKGFVVAVLMLGLCREEGKEDFAQQKMALLVANPDHSREVIIEVANKFRGDKMLEFIANMDPFRQSDWEQLKDFI